MRRLAQLLYPLAVVSSAFSWELAGATAMLLLLAF